MSTQSGSQAAPDLTRESKFQSLTRLGFVARGLLYMIIALLLIGTGRTEDVTGAIDYLGGNYGRLLLLLLAAGLGAYGLWRMADAALGMESGRHHWRATGRRIGSALIGAIYLYLAWLAGWALLLGRSGGRSPRVYERMLLDMPLGQTLLAIAGIVLTVAGVFQLFMSRSCIFMAPLRDNAQRPWVRWLGRIGYAARGIIFLAAAFLIARAASLNSVADAGGMEQALDLLSGPIQFAVAGGLVLFGAFSLIEARYRRIHHPPIAHVADKITEKIAG
ncbi:MAG: DUF1206 domain-containing protein [Sphingomicrobium sp.]